MVSLTFSVSQFFTLFEFSEIEVVLCKLWLGISSSCSNVGSSGRKVGMVMGAGSRPEHEILTNRSWKCSVAIEAHWMGRPFATWIYISQNCIFTCMMVSYQIILNQKFSVTKLTPFFHVPLIVYNITKIFIHQFFVISFCIFLKTHDIDPLSCDCLLLVYLL